MNPDQRVMVLVAALAGVPAVVLGAIALLAGGPVVGVVVLVVVAAALAGLVVAGADTRVRGAVGGRPADPDGDARLINLVEGLTVGAGVHPPELLVLDDDGLNLAVYGRRHQHPVVVVTAGLLAELTRIELEGILAAALAEIRTGATGPATVVAGIRGIGASWVVPADRDSGGDLAAVALTRYPPGLAAALDKMDAKGTALQKPPGRTGLLWLADPGGPSQVQRTPLQTRIEAVSEL